ncbi:alpha/beta hydrolase [Herbaspirillum seropedicae]|uniref:esterase/lipase family protein n=1 Tax=Herbaspirillum seropedicae TaxID=964 RepID=UPI001124252D|nr:alpha/beta hydrolase [Herbaspirillum seropedicae]QDD62711.1 alpha/beta hydrolase [Herbaspirillum seropedicae]
MTRPTAAAGPMRLVPTAWDEAGNDVMQSVLTGKSMKVRALCLTTPDVVIPIVFVPGIMGTRLKVKGRIKDAAWFPPDGGWESLVLALRHIGRTAADRQRLLNPNTTEVDDDGPAFPDDISKTLLGFAPGKTDAERVKWRGWGQLHASSYLSILSLLESSMALIFDPASQGKKLTSHWQDLVMSRQDAAKLGAQKPFKPLQERQLQDAAEFLYPVHAVGYNWLQSNKVSAQRLASEIERITAYYRSKGRSCEEVIVVTHSMGGLVARACAQLPEMAERILGVVHGVMPAIGAPATYKRIRAGFEGIGQVVLGRNGAECTAVMANAPGPLELLPTAQYKTWTNQGERHWLRVSYLGIGQRGLPQEMESFLGEGDPYAKIYLNNTADWWKLIQEDLVDPVAREKREKLDSTGKVTVKEPVSAFKKFRDNLEAARKLHSIIKDQYHRNSYAYYASDPERLTWNEVQWKCQMPVPSNPQDALLANDDLNGSVELLFKENKRSRFLIQVGRGKGDGTVPAESAESARKHVVQIFKHGGSASGHDSYDHQYSYNSPTTQAVTLYAIVKMVSESNLVRRS